MIWGVSFKKASPALRFSLLPKPGSLLQSHLFQLVDLVFLLLASQEAVPSHPL